MPSIEEKIKAVEEEIKKTPVNKGTEAHLAKLKAKLARLKEELEERKEKSKGKSIGFAVKKTGDATVVLVGPPSVGKSSLLNVLTNAESETGEYAFTTTTVIPGMMEYKDAKIQILDVPGIIEGASCNKGRGKEVLSVVRVADLICLTVDIYTYSLLPNMIKELYDVGIRINEEPPKIKIKKMDKGSIKIFKKVPCKLSDEAIKNILREFKIVNAEIIIEEDITAQRLIDALSKNRAYVKAAVIINKVDEASCEQLKEIEEFVKKLFPNSYFFISAKYQLGIEELKNGLVDLCNLMRIYTRKPGKKEEVMIIKKNATVKDVCEKIRSDFVDNFKFARVYGKSVKFPGQKVGLDHVLQEGDVVEIHLKNC